MRDSWLESRIAATKKFGIAAIFGLALILAAFAPKEDQYKYSLIFVGVLLIIPFMIHETLFTIWHWKRRYRGEHSDLWGALLVIETSGWFKIVYWFRHILPDWRGTGRYSDQLDEGKEFRGL